MANDTMAISPRWSVVSASAPANPFDGQLWRDTSVDVLKQYDAGSDTWETVQTSPDGSSIGETPAGNLRVLRPSVGRIGSFENGEDGWTVTPNSDDDTGTADATRAVEGSQSFYFSPSSGREHHGIEVDLTGVSEVRAWMYGAGSFDDSVDDNGIGINPNDGIGELRDCTAYVVDTHTGSWQENVLDVSDYSGTYYVLVAMRTGGTGEMWWDDVRLVYDSLTFDEVNVL